MSTPDHDRVCSLANQAMESLLDKQRHAESCSQCKADPKWCRTADRFDAEFMELFSHWRANRPSGGVITRGSRPT